MELRTTKFLSRRSDRPIHDVQFPFACGLRSILEVGYERFRLRDQDVDQSKPAMNHASVVNLFHRIDNVNPEAMKP